MEESKSVFKWIGLKDEELLQQRICDLGLRLEGSGLEESILQLEKELAAKGLSFRPRIYLGDEWFSPEGMVAISVPFYLAHPRLVALEKKFMLEVEGENPTYFLKLLRHEAGHCFDHAYGFSKRRKWQKIFGSPGQDYHPETYRPRPYSRSFVKNLDNWYAQSHPDEDFAETFAVWLAEDSHWETLYAQWPKALEKLQYVDTLAQDGSKIAPQGIQGYLPYSAARMKTTLQKYYAKRRKENAEHYPDFYDEDLKRIFNGPPHLSKQEYGAGKFMHRNSKNIVNAVTVWTTERKYHVHSLVKKLTLRCDALNLRIGKTEAQTSLDVAAYLSALVTHYVFTGRFKRTL